MPGDIIPMVGSVQTYVDILYLQKADQRIVTEEIPCIKTGDQVEVRKIPFHARRLAFGDIIAVEYDETDRAYYFNKRVTPSGNSTIWVLFDEPRHLLSLRSDLEESGCGTEFAPSMKILAVNVPKNVPYAPIKRLLESGERAGWWQYEESCLSHPLAVSPNASAKINWSVQIQKCLERVGLIVQRERLHHDESEESLAATLGITVSALTRIESGFCAGVEFVTILALCQHYRIGPEDILFERTYKSLSVC